MQRKKIFKKFIRTFLATLFLIQVVQNNTAKGLDKSLEIHTSKYSLEYNMNLIDYPIDNLIITANIPLDNMGNKIGTWDNKLTKLNGITIEEDGTKLIYKKKKIKIDESLILDLSIKISENIKNGTKFEIPLKVNGDNIKPFTIILRNNGNGDLYNNTIVNVKSIMNKESIDNLNITNAENKVINSKIEKYGDNDYEVYVSYDDPQIIDKTSKENTLNWIPYEENIIEEDKVTAIKIHCKDVSTKEIESLTLNNVEDTIEETLEVNKPTTGINDNFSNKCGKDPIINIKDNKENKINKLISQGLNKDNKEQYKKVNLDNLNPKESVKERTNPLDNNISNGNIAKSICEDKYEDKDVIKVMADNINTKEYKNLCSNCCRKSYNNLLGAIVTLVGIVGLIISKKSKAKN